MVGFLAKMARWNPTAWRLILTLDVFEERKRLYGSSSDEAVLGFARLGFATIPFDRADKISVDAPAQAALPVTASSCP